MSGTAPDPDETSWSPGASEGAYRRGRSARGWVVGVIGGVLAVLVVLVVLGVWQPWQGGQDPEIAATTLEATVVPSATPSPGAPPSSAPTPAPAPGADAVFDATSLSTLFVTPADLAAGVPGAAAGVRRGVEPGTTPWGLPEGSTVEPASCTVAATVTADPPAHYDATSWTNDDLTFAQDVVVLPDRESARSAFAALVTAVDECPRWAQVVDGEQRRAWTAEPAIEGQGVFPAIVHDVTLRTGDRTLQQTSGHVLVGNAIVSWTASARTAEDRESAQKVVGPPADLADVVERRALAAVRGLT